jgi:RNA polymerase sigma factor for flagellar operon FliA
VDSLRRDPPTYKERIVLDPRDLLVDNLDVVRRAIRYAARRYGFELEEFEGEVMVRLAENDYADLRAFEGRSSFRTYISTVVQLKARDYADYLWGKWRPSAEAKRLGPLAVDLERLLRRDGLTIEEAVTRLQATHKDVSHASLRALEARLPLRQPRPRFSSLDSIDEPPPVQARDPNERLLAEEQRKKAQEITRVISPTLARLTTQDRLILNWHFVHGMSFARIARAEKLHQKLIYRRMEQIKREIRRELEKAGFRWEDIADLIGRDEAFLHFDIGNLKPSPSTPVDESTDDESTEPDDEGEGPDTEEP